MGKIWAVCSGSGGVGKTTIALSLAVGAAKMGKDIILLDASGVSRSSDLILGLESVVVLDMLDVFHDQITLNSVLYPVPQYERLRYACASLYDSIPVCELSTIALALHSLCDILIVDLPTGVGDLGRGVLREGDERLFITRPDNASIRSCERLMQRYRGHAAANSLIINRSSRESIKKKTQFPQDTVQNLLDQMAIACIPEDTSISDAELHNKAAIECSGPARSILSRLVKSLLGSA